MLSKITLQKDYYLQEVIEIGQLIGKKVIWGDKTKINRYMSDGMKWC